MSLSVHCCPTQVLRSFYVQPLDVHYFVHDSGPYMFPTAERLRSIFGYRNLVDVPCWAHLLNLVGEALFNQKMLPELQECMRLSRLLFARSPFWRRKWREHQMEVHAEEAKKVCFVTWACCCTIFPGTPQSTAKSQGHGPTE